MDFSLSWRDPLAAGRDWASRRRPIEAGIGIGARALSDLPQRDTDRRTRLAAPLRPFDPRPDGELLDLVRRRDEAALAALYDRYGGLVFTVALRVLGDRELAEEVM